MTPREQIAYLRDWCEPLTHPVGVEAEILAVCDLAERALAAERALEVCQTKCDRLTIKTTLTDNETEASRAFQRWGGSHDWPEVKAVLRRLLGEEVNS
jgi:hypothetical protein